MDFSVEMGRIAQGIRRAAEERAGSIAGTRQAVRHLRAETLSFLKEARRRNSEMGHRSKDELAHFMAGLQSDVHGLLRQSHGSLRGFAADFQRGGKLFRRTLCGQTAMPAPVRGESRTRGKAERSGSSRRQRG